MSGSKAPDFDTYELFRATRSHNSPWYHHNITILTCKSLVNLIKFIRALLLTVAVRYILANIKNV